MKLANRTLEHPGLIFFRPDVSARNDRLKRLAEEVLNPADVRINGDRLWDIQVRNPEFFKAAFMQGSLGLGESYMNGWWDCKSLDQLFCKGSAAVLEGRIKIPPSLIIYKIKDILFNRQARQNAFRNYEHHYEIGNDFYQSMLDRRMVNSCADWSRAQNLDEAQEAKLEMVCRKLKLKAGMRVLDMGCGWGSFIKYASQYYGVDAIGMTCSVRQAELGRKFCRETTAEIRHQDCKQVKGKFDRAVCLNMFEQAGPKNYRKFMETAHASLEKSGIFVLHTIGSNDSRPSFDPWMDKYIFPGARLPSATHITEATEGLFMIDEWQNASSDYDRTLMAWFNNFEHSWPRFQKNYGERFYRMWKYYLLSCAGMFRARRLQLWRIVLSKQGA
jgi:cyclopropane-fatty-acyl-phospholipid synthase